MASSDVIAEREVDEVAWESDGMGWVGMEIQERNS